MASCRYKHGNEYYLLFLCLKTLFQLVIFFLANANVNKPHVYQRSVANYVMHLHFVLYSYKYKQGLAENYCPLLFLMIKLNELIM